MFDHYALEVLRDYQKKKASGGLSLNLDQPTPGHLKDECVVVYERFQKKDEKVIKAFFGTREDATAYVLAMRNHDADKFRPLVGFLKGRIKKTDRKNIELLAWLIDYEPRPFKFEPNSISQADTGTKPDGGIHEQDVTPLVGEDTEPQGSKIDSSVLTDQILIDENGVNNDPATIKQQESTLEKERRASEKVTVPNTATINGDKRKLILVGLIAIVVLICVVGVFIFKKPTYTGQEKCMYWTGEVYQPVSCNEKIAGATILALDSTLVLHFKKIMRPDTLTTGSIGKVWWAKVNNKYEFYTDSGIHPLHPEKRLLHLTARILNNNAHN